MMNVRPGMMNQGMQQRQMTPMQMQQMQQQRMQMIQQQQQQQAQQQQQQQQWTNQQQQQQSNILQKTLQNKPGGDNPTLKGLLNNPPHPPQGMMNIAGQQRPNMPQQQQQQQQQQQRGPGMSALEAQLNKPPNQMPNQGMKPSPREIWKGNLNWKNPKSDGQEQAMHNVMCRITSQVNESNEPVVRSDNWPERLIMQLIPKTLVSTIGK